LIREGPALPILCGAAKTKRVTALVYLRAHPEILRSVVLMEVAPTNAKLPMYHKHNGQRAMELLFDECAANFQMA
jgi:hypothetical protein